MKEGSSGLPVKDVVRFIAPFVAVTAGAIGLSAFTRYTPDELNDPTLSAEKKLGREKHNIAHDFAGLAKTFADLSDLWQIGGNASAEDISKRVASKSDLVTKREKILAEDHANGYK